jgi:Kef-type K+ transport system membrane component KefB
VPVPHLEPIAFVLLTLAIILAAARFGGSAAERFAQPAVLGELLVGVVLGISPGWPVTGPRRCVAIR